MREIKFRGKLINLNAFIYGNYHYSEKQNKHFITGESRDYHFKMMEVDPKTVGEYTGLKDKNGKEIFEGDVVSSEIHEPSCFNIQFYEGAFCATNDENIYFVDINHFFSSTGCCLEVIGNIHEKSELLTEL